MAKNKFGETMSKNFGKKLVLFLFLLALGMAIPNFVTNYKFKDVSKQYEFFGELPLDSQALPPIEVTGTLFVKGERGLYAKREGIVVSVNVEPGDTVKKGQIVAELEPVDIPSVGTSYTVYDRKKFGYKDDWFWDKTKVKRALDRINHLEKIGFYSHVEAQQKRNVFYKLLKDASARTVSKGRSQQDRYRYIRAPYDGVITGVNWIVGDQALAIGNKLIEPGMWIAEKNFDYQVKLEIPEDIVANININDAIEAYIPLFDEAQFDGKIKSVNRVIYGNFDDKSSSRHFRALADLKRSKQAKFVALHSGTRVRANILRGKDFLSMKKNQHLFWIPKLASEINVPTKLVAKDVDLVEYGMIMSGSYMKDKNLIEQTDHLKQDPSRQLANMTSENTGAKIVQFYVQTSQGDILRVKAKKWIESEDLVAVYAPQIDSYKVITHYRVK